MTGRAAAASAQSFAAKPGSRYDMNGAYLSALAALPGSAVGALASVMTTWLTLNTQERTRRLAQGMSRKENLYGEFLEEASKRFSEALTHNFEDASVIVYLYSLIGKLRLFAPADVLLAADEVIRRIIHTYTAPSQDLSVLANQLEQPDLDILRKFCEACRRD
jgi:hypothetical protein